MATKANAAKREAGKVSAKVEKEYKDILSNLRHDIKECGYELLIDAVSPGLHQSDCNDKIGNAIHAVAELKAHLVLAEEHLAIISKK